MPRRPVSNGGGFTPSDTLGLTSRATSIRRIRIQRGPGSMFTHTSNNARGRVRFQKKVSSLVKKTLKFSNAVFRRHRGSLNLEGRWSLPSEGSLCSDGGDSQSNPCLKYSGEKVRGAFGAPRTRRRIFCSELRSRSAERIRCTSLLNRVGIFAHPHETHPLRVCSL
jgi:hypothetical protein